jgi:carboxymethylenebutenolidase
MALPIQQKTIEIQSGVISIPVYLAHPEEAEGLPVVVVIQEVFGVNSHIRAVTDRLAQTGYIAIAPHIYHHQVTGFEVGYSQADLAQGRIYKDGTRAEELLEDIQGAINYAQTHFQNVPKAAGCIGFCFGGHVAYLAATLPNIQATASFYGAGIPHFCPGGGAPTLTLTPKIQGTLYAFFGLDDPLIPVSDIDAVEAALQKAGIKHRVFRYPSVEHGFFCDQRESYNVQAAADAWEHTQQLFQEVLK